MTPAALPRRLVLLGHPVAHSLSPRFQNAALRAAGIPLEYTALDVPPDALRRTLATLREEDAAGNVTIPHKRPVALACSHVTDAARRAGAVNTFWFESGDLCGDNTDVAGFATAVERLLQGTAMGWPHRIAVLGAGGAARAVLVAAEQRGSARVDVVARDPARALALAADFPIATAAGAAAAQQTEGSRARSALGHTVLADDVDLVVNATPVGLEGDTLPIAPDRIPSGAAVLDLVYRRGGTPWSHACRAAGHRADDGMEMLLAQGALAFRRFTGRAPDLDVMRAALATE